MKLRRLKQRDKTGCGLACVAMVTGKKYGEIKKQAIELGVVEPKGPFGTFSRDIRLLLKKNQRKAMGGRKAKHWDNLPDLAIAGINYSEAAGEWHWVVFVRTASDAYVLDPWHKTKASRRRDFGRMRLRSSIPIRAQPTVQGPTSPPSAGPRP